MTIPDPLERAPLAYENAEFLDSPDGRLLRIMSEYAEPMARFQRQRIQDTVVFFGSARFHSEEATKQALTGLEGDALTRGQTAVEMARFYEDARTLSGMLTSWAKTLPGKHHRFVVTSGGGPGIMEAANRGAYEAGGKSIGLNIKLPREQFPNPYITPELNFEFHYFFMRKFWFAYLAKALVIFPGGFGTLDEMFEIVTLAQTHKLAKNIPILIYGTAYWNKVLNIEALIEHGAVSPEDRALFHYADTPEDAFAILKATLAGEVSSRGKMQRDDPAGDGVPAAPAPTSQELLGPDIAKTRG
ncbi:LOG family protein [Granulicella arctica]|uniref:LOG family protein n=1 Tax=Granulicella arctica TaxID=940613 RepID=UPI0021DF7F8F|nr:TIGR00730 family Rossman fold protein [Granulicella arctica]